MFSSSYGRRQSRLHDGFRFRPDERLLVPVLLLHAHNRAGEHGNEIAAGITLAFAILAAFAVDRWVITHGGRVAARVSGVTERSIHVVSVDGSVVIGLLSRVSA